MKLKTAGLLLIAAAAVAALASALLDDGGDTQAIASVKTRLAPGDAAPLPTPPTATTPAPAAPAAFTHYRVGNAAARAIHAEGAVMWVGTSTGLVRYDTGSGEHRYFNTRDGLKSDAILHIGNHKGRLVVGTHGGGLAFFDPSAATWEHYGVAEGLPDARVFDALEAHGGDLWIATWAGVLHVPAGRLGSRGDWRHYTVENTSGALPGNRIYALAEHANGAIWAATEGGAARYQRGKWTSWKREGGAAAADAVSIAITHNGVVWIGTLGSGLIAFDGKRWRSYTKADGLPGNRVFALHEDGARQLWIGTDNGLARRAEGRFATLGTADGLLGNVVFSVAAPPDGTLWVGGNGGVAHIRRYALHEIH